VANAAVDCETLNAEDEHPVYFGANKNTSWQIVHGGTYDISLDTVAETVTFERTADLAPVIENVWIAGTASGMGAWNPPRNETGKMTDEGNGVFTWTGNFTAGTTYFRFTVNNQNNPNGEWFTPPGNNGDTPTTVDTSQGVEYVLGTANSTWTLSAGTYTVTLDTDNLTLLVAVPPPQVTGVSVSPPTITMLKGTSETFTETVTVISGASQAVTWSIDETPSETGTAVDAYGVLTVDANETLGSLTVRATSTADSGKSGTAAVTLFAASYQGVTGISVSPATATVIKGGTQQFTETVTVLGGAAQTVTWSIVETPTVGTTGIDSSGELTVDAAETLTELTVRATSDVMGFTGIYGEATVTVTDFVASGFDVWLSGGASPGGWPTLTGTAIPSGTNLYKNAMTDAGSGVFTWTGPLTANTVQFVSTRGGNPNWNSSDGDWFTRNSTTAITLDTPQTVEVVNGQKNGWTVPSAGDYTITLDTGASTVLFVKN
jgi:hypothetical protein